MTTWNPTLYLKHSRARTRPALDLANQIPLEDPKRIVDLGCGTGTSTRILSTRWPNATVEGIDSSTDMLETAASESDKIKWTCLDLRDWIPEERYDIIFSNATFQWLDPINGLFERIVASLESGGVFAFQVPNNEDAPYHLCIVEVANRGKWKHLLNDVIGPLRYDSMSYYFDLLSGSSTRIDAWETRYYQVMEGAEAIVDWVCGTGLLPYLQALPEESLRTEFKDDLLELYRASFPPTADGKILFPFNRQFVVAQKE